METAHQTASATQPRFGRAIIINPPNPTGYTSNKDSMGGFGQLYGSGAPPAPPLDLPYLAAYLHQAEVPLTIIEAGAEKWSIAQSLEHINNLGIKLDESLCLVRTSIPTIDWDLDFCLALKTECRPAGIALTGSPVGALSSRIQQDANIDFAISGEPDDTVLELINGADLDAILGLSYRNEDNHWVENQQRPFQKDLDKLPEPAWDLFPHEKYIIPRSSNTGILKFLPMLASRGCPFGCNYCPYPVGQGLKWRFRSPSNVVDEIEHLIEKYHVEYILFRDPMFSARKKRVQEICEEIIRRKLKVSWRCETRIDCLDEATIDAMARGGCTGVNFGVESIDPDVQKAVERTPITPDEIRHNLHLLHKHGIQTFAFFVVGLPGDTFRTILDSLDFATSIDVGYIQFTVSTPFIGTKLHKWAVDQGRIENGFYKIISAHEGSVGNEALTPVQIHRLHLFSQFLQKNLLNRRGILKNHTRHDPLYSAARSIANWLGKSTARSLVRLLRLYLKMSKGKAVLDGKVAVQS